MAHRISITAEDLSKSIDRASMGGYLIKPKTVQASTALCFSSTAWVKMQALIRDFDVEVAWHGIVHKEDDEHLPGESIYVVDDILVYPQTVTSATVDTDVDEYGSWLSSLDDDEINSLRLQGHSHVNMGVSPSGVDISCENDILSQVSDDGFYIFVIWNKKGDKTIRIFDFEDDIVYETSDVDVVIEDCYLEDFLGEAHSIVKHHVSKPDKRDYEYYPIKVIERDNEWI